MCVKIFFGLFFLYFSSNGAKWQCNGPQQCVYSCEIKKSNSRTCEYASSIALYCKKRQNTQLENTIFICDSPIDSSECQQPIILNNSSCCSVLQKKCTISDENTIELTVKVTFKEPQPLGCTKRYCISSVSLYPNDCNDKEYDLSCEAVQDNTAQSESLPFYSTSLTDSAKTHFVNINTTSTLTSSNSITSTSANTPSHTTSANSITSISANNETSSDESKQVHKDGKDLIIGLVAAFVAVFVILLIVFIVFWRKRAKRNPLSTTSSYDKNDTKVLSSITDPTIYHQIDKNDKENHQYWSISGSGTNAIPQNSPNPYSTLPEDDNGGYDVQRALSVVSPEAINVAACSSAYFVLESEEAKQDYGSAGSYFTLEKDDDAKIAGSNISDANVSIISPGNYSKLGEIKRETLNAYDMATDSESVVLNLNSSHVSQQLNIDAPTENAAIYSMARNATNSFVPDECNLPQSRSDSDKYMDSTANYFELENHYFETHPNSNDDRDKGKLSS